jgi:hypothetical protein
MSQIGPEFLDRARRARDKLGAQFLGHPDVRLIDIGHDPDEAENNKVTKRIVLRVHVKQPLSKEKLGLPPEIDGIPVRVVVADYRLE